MLKGIICGKGGQGIITVNYMLGLLASELKYPVISAETHGMAMRGGSVATAIKIGDFASASISKGDADFILSMDLDEALRNFEYLKPEGYCIINTDKEYSFPKGYNIISVNANKIAENQFGKRILAGQILVGYVIRTFIHLFKTEQCLTILANKKRVNIEAITLGIEAGC